MPDLAPLSPQWWLEQLFTRLMERRDEIEFFDAYYRGDHPLPWLAPQAREEFRRILRMTRSNYCGLVIDAQVERVNIEGFRVGDDGQQDAETWRIFQANNLDSDSDQAILEAAICGRSYLQVAPNPADASTPSVWVEHPSQAILAYAPGTNRRQRAAGLKVWDDDWTGQLMATLQLGDGSMWKFQAKRPEAGGKPQWVERFVTGEAENGLRRNPLGVVSLVEIPNNPRLLHGGVSELSDITDIQDRANKTIADRLITQDYGAFPQRWISAWPEEDAQGNPNPQIDIGRNRVITTEVAETKFGQWDAAPLDPYSNAKREDVKDIASRTRTPAQYLLGEMTNVNGATLQAAESGLVSKVVQRSRGYGEGFEEAMRLARIAAGISSPADAGMETIFTNPQYRTPGEMADATMKLFGAGIVSLRQAREDLGYSVAQIERMEADDAAAKADPTMERLMRELTSAPSAPSGDGGLLPQPAVPGGANTAGGPSAVGADGARL